MSTNPRRTSNTNITTFQTFFQGWLVRQQQILDELRSVLQTYHDHETTDEHLHDLITRVLAHYQEYYEEKSRIANHDVFLVFSPPWYSPFERSFFWIAGVKPGLAFRLIQTSVDDLSIDQVEMMKRLKAEIATEEKGLEGELARIQESVAAPPIVDVAKKMAVEEMGDAVEGLRVEMEAVLANAELLRTRTAERVAEILSPVQIIKFLTSLTEFQMRIRMWGSHLSR